MPHKTSHHPLSQTFDHSQYQYSELLRKQKNQRQFLHTSYFTKIRDNGKHRTIRNEHKVLNDRNNIAQLLISKPWKTQYSRPKPKTNE